jgi:hypothetical protein
MRPLFGRTSGRRGGSWLGGAFTMQRRPQYCAWLWGVRLRNALATEGTGDGRTGASCRHLQTSALQVSHMCIKHAHCRPLLDPGTFRRFKHSRLTREPARSEIGVYLEFFASNASKIGTGDGTAQWRRWSAPAERARPFRLLPFVCKSSRSPDVLLSKRGRGGRKVPIRRPEPIVIIVV